MAWFVLTNDGMRLRVRYPQTPEACQTVGTWSQLVTEGLRELAGVKGESPRCGSPQVHPGTVGTVTMPVMPG